MRRIAAIAVVCLAFAGPLRGEGGAAVAGRIVNGLPTAEYPSVGLFVTELGTCTATLIGCRTALTAAHCVCLDAASGRLLTGAECAGRADLLDPAAKFLYLPHAGRFAVARIAVDPSFVFAQGGDLAIVQLASTVTGVAPAALDTTGKPPAGTPGTIVGFGITEDPSSGGGIERTGAVAVAPCSVSGVDASHHVCADLTAPLGPPATSSGPCVGDSGGPLFVDLGGGPVLAGSASGDNSASAHCAPPSHFWFADLYAERDWIRSTAGAELGTGACGGLPAAGGPDAPVSQALGTLSAAHPEDVVPLAVPAGASRLRVGLSADSPFANNDDLYLQRGSPPTTTRYDCKSEAAEAIDFCDVALPAAGTWYALVHRASGHGGPYQLVETLFARPGAAPCVPSATTLCLDDQPGDQRFQVEVSFQTAGAAPVPGHAVPLASLGLSSGGLFWFFNPSNPEMLVKVLNGCSLGGHYWVFSAAGTNVGLQTTVIDTVTGARTMYSNPLGTAAPPVQDTSALPCS
jgi:hypothetical protein